MLAFHLANLTLSPAVTHRLLVASRTTSRQNFSRSPAKSCITHEHVQAVRRYAAVHDVFD